MYCIGILILFLDVCNKYRFNKAPVLKPFQLQNINILKNNTKLGSDPC